MADEWESIIADKSFQELPVQKKVQIAHNYFQQNVAADQSFQELDVQKQGKVKSNFYKTLQTQEPSTVGKGVNALKRTAGVVLGTFNAPLAAVWGSLTPAETEIEKEEFAKLPLHKQMAVRVGSGLESAYESATKEGSFGKGAGSYYKSVTGKEAPMAYDLVFNTMSDPLIIGGLAKGLARGGFQSLKELSSYLAKGKTPVPRETYDMYVKYLKQNPEQIIADINKLDSITAQEKKEAQEKLLWLLGRRKSEAQWHETWGGKRLDELERAEAEATQEIATRKTIAKNFETNKEKLMADKLAEEGIPPKEYVAGVENQGEAILKTPPPKLQGAEIYPEEVKLPEGMERYQRTEPPISPVTMEEKVVAEGTPWQLRGEGRETPEYPVGLGLTDRSVVPPKVPLQDKTLTIPRQPLSSLQGSMQGAQMHGVVAAGAGIEQDENGNFKFNPEKAIAGLVGGVAFGKYFMKNRRLAKELSNTPELKKVYDMVGKEKSFSFSGLLPKLNEYIFNRYAPLKDVSRKTYDEAILFQSYKDVSWMKFKELQKAMLPVRNADDIMTMYVDAHRALSRAKNGIKNPNGVTGQEAATSIKQAEALYVKRGGNVNDLRDAFNGFQDWSRKYILKEFKDSGFLSKEAYDTIIKRNQFYAAFQVLEKIPDNIHSFNPGGGGEFFSVASQDVVKTMKGTERKIADPIQATVEKFTKAQALIARNKVASIFVDDPASQQFIRPIASSAKEMQIMKNQGMNPVAQGSWSVRDFDTISRFKDGKVEKYLVPKDIAECMKRLTPWQAPRAIHAINTVFRQAATTLYLPFTVRNMFRDGLMAYTTSPVYEGVSGMGKFSKDWIKGLFEGMKYEFGGKSQLTEQYLKAGGGFGWSGELRSKDLARKELFKNKIDIVTDLANPLKWIEKLSSSVELAPRLGVYDRAFSGLGTSAKEAAHLARTSTIDFTKGGVATKVFNQFTPFVNARVQAWNNVRLAIQKNPKQTLPKMFYSVLLPGMGLYAYNRYYHSDLLDDIPSYVRDNYFTFITGTDVDKEGKTVPKYFVIPKGDVGTLVMNPLEYGLDQAMEKDPDNFGKFITNWVSDLSPIPIAREGELSGSRALGSILPPVVKGGIEDIAGKNLYTGGDIVPKSMLNKPPEFQYKENTPELYKALGEKLGVSPLRIQNFAQSLFAGYGREGLSPKAMLEGLTGTFMKARGGEKANKAWGVIEDTGKRYNLIRAKAQMAIKNGDEESAQQLMETWNDGLEERLSKLEKYGFSDEGGLYKQFSFSGEKMRDIISGKEIEGGLENKLKPKKTYKYKD